MPLTSGVNHVALVTEDLDRLVEFYESVFEANVFGQLTEGPVRHAMIGLGAGMALHPVSSSGTENRLALSRRLIVIVTVAAMGQLPSGLTNDRQLYVKVHIPVAVTARQTLTIRSFIILLELF